MHSIIHNETQDIIRPVFESMIRPAPSDPSRTLVRTHFFCKNKQDRNNVFFSVTFLPFMNIILPVEVFQDLLQVLPEVRVVLNDLHVGPARGPHHEVADRPVQ